METNGILSGIYDANQVVAGVDDSTGIEALRGAWSRRVDGFRALYLEHGEISNDTDAKVAVALSASLRAPITAAVVGHFRREIGLRRFERRSRQEDANGAAPTELPFDPTARQQPVSDEIYVVARLVPALVISAYSADPAMRVESVKALGDIAVNMTRHVLQRLREAHS